MNQEIEQAIKESGLKQWQIAKACGVSEATFVRWKREEFTAERKALVMEAIRKEVEKRERTDN